MVGTDRSGNLLEIARDKGKGIEVFVAESLKLPLRNACVDHVISIAVIHHFSSEDLRLNALRELERILKVGGTMLGNPITAFSLISNVSG
jgi:ubiquinone/menaquinone biosynthesis C-methylase UbiE